MRARAASLALKHRRSPRDRRTRFARIGYPYAILDARRKTRSTIVGRNRFPFVDPAPVPIIGRLIF